MSEHLEQGPELTIIPSDLPPGIPVPDNPPLHGDDDDDA